MGVKKELWLKAHNREKGCKKAIFAKRDTKEHKKGVRTRKHKGQSSTVNIKHLKKHLRFALPEDAEMVEAKAAVALELRQRGRGRRAALEEATDGDVAMRS